MLPPQLFLNFRWLLSQIYFSTSTPSVKIYMELGITILSYLHFPRIYSIY
ncbi:hypothetical protein Peur_006251 [Populus x canadensis]